MRKTFAILICMLMLGAGSVSPVNRSPFSREERLNLAHQYLQQMTFMRVREYADFTHMPYSSAAKELRALAEDPQSGITFSGRGNTKVYILRK